MKQVTKLILDLNLQFVDVRALVDSFLWAHLNSELFDPPLFLYHTSWGLKNYMERRL